MLGLSKPGFYTAIQVAATSLLNIQCKIIYENKNAAEYELDLFKNVKIHRQKIDVGKIPTRLYQDI